MKRNDLRLKKINASTSRAILNILKALRNQAIAEAHQRSNTRILLGTSNHVLAQESALDPVGEGVQSSHDTERCKTIVETLDEALNIFALLDEAKGSTEANFRDDVISHEDSPWCEVKRLVGSSKVALEAGHPGVDVSINQRFHLLDVGETVERGGDLSVLGVHNGILHIEERFIFAEATSDVVL